MIHNKWITCTPVAFSGDEKTFFSRDSGLCCRTLQALGVRATAIMPEPAGDKDAPDLLRVPYHRLSDPEFWRRQNVDAVVFYSWAEPRYTSIAYAIKQSGTKLFINLDSGGVRSPFVEPWAYILSVSLPEIARFGRFRGSLIAAAKWCYNAVAVYRHRARLRHMACADIVGVVSPLAAQTTRKFARFYGRPDVAEKIHFVSHPIDQTMQYAGCAKQEKVIVVGRWDDSVKRPDVLIKVVAAVLRRNSTVQFSIIGKDSLRCVSEIEKKMPGTCGRIHGFERLTHDQLCDEMCSAQVSLCTSRSEGFHTASGEALLCGCSVVSPRSPLLPSLPYFTDEGRSGRLSENNPDALADAVLAELNTWKAGGRNPAHIAAVWRERIAAGAVMKQIDRLLVQGDVLSGAEFK